MQQENLHLLAQSRDITGDLAEAVATIVVGFKLVTQMLKHGGVGVPHNWLGGCFCAIKLFGIAMAVSLEARRHFIAITKSDNLSC